MPATAAGMLRLYVTLPPRLKENFCLRRGSQIHAGNHVGKIIIEFSLLTGSNSFAEVETSPIFQQSILSSRYRRLSVHIRNKLPAAYRSSSAGGSRRHVTAICDPGLRRIFVGSMTKIIFTSEVTLSLNNLSSKN